MQGKVHRRILPIHVYVGVIAAVGFALGTFVVVGGVRAEFDAATPAVWLLAGLVILGELYPIRVPLRDDAEEITTSPAFMFALLLLSGPALAIIAQTIAALLSDIHSRKAWWKASFNIGQYALAIAGAGRLSQPPSIRASVSVRRRCFRTRTSSRSRRGVVTSFVLNNTFVIAAIAISQRISIVGQIRNNLGFHTATTMVLIAQGPLIALAALHSLLWVLLFLPGILAVYRTAAISVAKEQLATHDSLTGLPNRLLFRERLARHPRRDRGAHVVVMLIDLDRFKEVNDTLGHHVGDSLLSQVGERLREDAERHGTVARLGGDEFAVIATADDPRSGVVARALDRAALDEPLSLQDLPFQIDVSIGAALCPQHGNDVDSLLQHADVAMYVAKERGTGFEVYNAVDDKYSPRRLSLLGDLRRAIDEGELVLHYQPIADLRTGEVTRMEALIRWEHPEYGLIQPNEFIPLAEPTGLMVPLTRRILDDAMRQCSEWNARGFDMRIAVNVAARSLHHTDLPAEISTLLEKWDVPARLARARDHRRHGDGRPAARDRDPRRVERARRADLARRLRYRLLVAGYLKRLPVSQLKIDASFVQDMVTNHDDTAIVSSTIDLARHLGLTVVAEGVESIAVWQRLIELGCDFAQGYLLSRPLPAEQMNRWLEARRCGRVALVSPEPKSTNINADLLNA